MVFAFFVAFCLVSCQQPASSSGTTTGSISGHAYFSNQSDHTGIVITAESTSSGKTAYVLSLEGKSTGLAKTIAAQATTTSSGSYSLGDLAAGTYTVYASSKNSLEKAVTTSVTVTAGKDTTASDLDLTPTGSISGTATIGGAGALGITVYIAGTSYAAITDTSGAYTISSVPVGSSYTLYAEKGDYTANATVTVTEGTTAKQNLALTEGAKDSDSTLSAISTSVGSLSPAFSKATTSYKLWVDASSSVTVAPTANSSKATVSMNEGQPTVLASGANPLSIIVVAEDGTKTTYSVEIIKGNYVEIATPASNSTITTNLFTTSGSWYSTVAPTITASLGGCPSVQAKVNSDNTWTATIDAHTIPNGTNKQFQVWANYVSTGTTASSNNYNTNDITYSGSSSMATYTLSGTVTLASAPTLASGQYLDIECSPSDGSSGSASAKIDIPLTTATTYSYSLNGLPDGTYSIWAQTHNSAWNQSNDYYYSGGNITIQDANAAYSFSIISLRND
jgi:hypothetical protein